MLVVGTIRTQLNKHLFPPPPPPDTHLPSTSSYLLLLLCCPRGRQIWHLVLLLFLGILFTAAPYPPPPPPHSRSLPFFPTHSPPFFGRHTHTHAHYQFPTFELLLVAAVVFSLLVGEQRHFFKRFFFCGSRQQPEYFTEEKEVGRSAEWDLRASSFSPFNPGISSSV